MERSVGGHYHELFIPVIIPAAEISVSARMLRGSPANDARGFGRLANSQPVYGHTPNYALISERELRTGGDVRWALPVRFLSR